MNMKDHQKRVILADAWIVEHMPTEHRETLETSLEILANKVSVLERLGETQTHYIGALVRVILGDYEDDDAAKKDIAKLETRMKSIVEQIEALNNEMKQFEIDEPGDTK